MKVQINDLKNHTYNDTIIVHLFNALMKATKFSTRVSVPQKSQRVVLYLSPGLAEFIESFPKRKRSEAVERMLQEYKESEEKKRAYEALTKARERLKGKATAKEIVEWLRKDRRSH